MILYIENPQNTTKKLLELINKYSKVAEYKINIQTSVAFLYIMQCICCILYNSELSERESKKTIPSTITSKKYLEINLTKIKDLYLENYKILKKAEEDTNKWKHIP